MVSDLDPFSWFIGRLLILFGNMFVQNLYPLINWHICYSVIELAELFVFWILIPYQICDFQMLLECWWVGDGGRWYCGLESSVVSEAASLGCTREIREPATQIVCTGPGAQSFSFGQLQLFYLDSVIKQPWHHPPHIPGEVVRECCHQFLVALFLGLIPLRMNAGKTPHSLFPASLSVTSELLLSKCSHHGIHVCRSNHNQPWVENIQEKQWHLD